jgi:hypothetical protein
VIPRAITRRKIQRGLSTTKRLHERHEAVAKSPSDKTLYIFTPERARRPACGWVLGRRRRSDSPGRLTSTACRGCSRAGTRPLARSSGRAGDPLLHTHVVVANATQGRDGRWTALDGRELYRHAKTAGYLYQAVLRTELSRELGLRWQAGERGTADVEGVGRRVIDHFSQRRAEILELMATRGESSARAAQVATLETRRRKEYGVPADRLRADWRARAAEHGLDRDALQRVLRRQPARSVDATDVADRLEGRDGLTRDRSTFTRRDVLPAFAEHARDGSTVASLESAPDAFLTRLVELEPVAGERRFTTRALLRLEHDATERARSQRYASAAPDEHTSHPRWHAGHR